MRDHRPLLRRLGIALRQRDWIGVTFELFVVVLGVALGLEASRWAAAREERAYRQQMVTALDETLKVYIEAGPEIRRMADTSIADHERRRAKGERPPPPYIHLTGLERPPTLAWDAMVATGIANSIEPKMIFTIARFFSRGDQLGDRYQRYNAFTESEVLPYLKETDRFYGGDGKLSPPYAAHVERLHDFLNVNDALTEEAMMIRRDLHKAVIR